MTVLDQIDKIVPFLSPIDGFFDARSCIKHDPRVADRTPAQHQARSGIADDSRKNSHFPVSAECRQASWPWSWLWLSQRIANRILGRVVPGSTHACAFDRFVNVVIA
jgi:hypothetical protein